MCVVAIAWAEHPRWQLVVAGNRDEYHARASASLGAWDDGSGIIAGRDMVSGGSWMGVSDSGRFAVVTNIRDADGPDPVKLSRGALVTDWLANGQLPEAPDRFNPFNLIVTGADAADYVSNRPTASRKSLGGGIHGLSNAVPDEHWPRKDRLMTELARWLENAPDHPEQLLDRLRDESIPDRDAHPIFINSPVYGTRCSTIVAVDHGGKGQMIERRFDASGAAVGEVSRDFVWNR